MSSDLNDSWHYLEINRGRYLCKAHGSFCDSSDNYVDKCPLCCNTVEKERPIEWVVNPIDRALQIIRNLQDRSKRSLAVVGSLSGFAGIVTFLGGDTTVAAFSTLHEGWKLIFVFGVAAILIAVVFYLLSMAHMPVVKQNAFARKTQNKWEENLATFLEKIECRHLWGSYFAVFGVICIVITLLFPPIIKEIQTYCWQLKNEVSQ